MKTTDTRRKPAALAAVLAAATLAAASAPTALASACRARDPVLGLFLYNESDPYIKEDRKSVV